MKVTLSKLDQLVKEGKILEAFDTYFSDDVVTYDESGNRTEGKAHKRALLESFFKDFTKTEEIALFDSFIDGNTSYSHFRFLFSKESGEKSQWDEVIVRQWKDKLVVSEFYSGQDYNQLKTSLVAPKRSTAAPKKVAAPKKTAEPKAAATPVAEEKATKTTAKAATTRASKAAAKTADAKTATPRTRKAAPKAADAKTVAPRATKATPKAAAPKGDAAEKAE